MPRSPTQPSNPRWPRPGRPGLPRLNRAGRYASLLIGGGRASLLTGLTSAILLVGWGVGCAEQAPHGDTDPGAPTSGQLPDFELRDDTEGLLITWLDSKGEFHVVQRLSEVPEGHRDRVRVVSSSVSAGHGALLYVADLTRKGPDGRYHVETMPRSAWDELGASRRRKRLEALAPSASAAAPAPSGVPAGALTAIVYGADWCKPCFQAEAHLKQRGVKVIHKDIERDPSAAQEMQQKLQRSGLGQGSIPIIDLGGRLFKGFSPSALDRAIESLRRSETL
ncbi:MAG: NrdH-redoxin [Polyangiaceae bacterium]|nr:NrdH-redoxin [Polyangiaceae bacterium]MCW5789201.1 NrdH-redoxin [Polyangiaceae bacterium]